MVRKCTLALVLVTALLAPRPASAVPVDLDLWLPTAGELFAGPLIRRLHGGNAATARDGHNPEQRLLRRYAVHVCSHGEPLS